MSYWAHLVLNWKVAAKGLLLAAFHFAHGLVPIELTSHERWGINFNKEAKKQ
jgi:hypothetical protein